MIFLKSKSLTAAHLFEAYKPLGPSPAKKHKTFMLSKRMAAIGPEILMCCTTYDCRRIQNAYVSNNQMAGIGPKAYR